MTGGRRVGWLLLAVPFALAALPFLRAWDYGLVNFDDFAYLVDHAEVRAWSGLASLKWCLTDTSEGIWMPLTWLSHAFDCAVFGEAYGGFHVHSIVLHALNAVLVFVFLRELFAALRRPEPPPAFLVLLVGTLLWAVHPLRCESVVAVSSRKDVLSFFWELCALVCWTRGSVRARGAALVLFAVGAMCKPSVMTFPALCLLVDGLLGRVTDLRRYAAAAVLAAAVGLSAAVFQQTGHAPVGSLDEPLWNRLLGACAAFGIYLRNTVWPDALAPQCLKRWPELPRFAVPGLVLSVAWLAALGTVAVRCVRRRRIAFGVVPAGLAWFAVAVAPMLGVAKFGYHAYADRFTYIPSVGLSILLVAALDALYRRGRGVWAAHAATGAAVLAVLALGVAAARQTGYWRDDRSLFTHTLEVDGDRNFYAHGVLGGWYFEFPHDLERCCREYGSLMRENIVASLPHFSTYVIALCELGRTEEAEARLRDYEAAVERLQGRERAWDILSGRLDLVEGVLPPRYVHACARLALGIWRPDGLRSAEAVVRELRGWVDPDDPTWLFLTMRLAERRGEKEEADRLRRRLLAVPTSAGYVRFRYLARESGHIGKGGGR